MNELPLTQAVNRKPQTWLRPSPINGRTFSLLIFLAALIWSIAQAGLFQRELVNQGGWTLAWRFVRASIQPDLSPDLARLALDSTLITLAYAACGTFASLVIGMAGGVLSSELWWQSIFPRQRDAARRPGLAAAPWLCTRAGLAIPRAIHEAIWGLFFINVIGLDPLVAILAIAIPFGAITAKVFAEIIDETPREPLRALLGSGAGTLKAFLYSIFPQALPDLLSYAFYRFECAIRSAAVLGLIGAGGLGYQLLLSLQSLRYEQMWTFLYALILLSGLTDVWSAVLRGRASLTGRIGLCRVGIPSGQPGDPVVRFSLLAAALLVPASFWYVGAGIGAFFEPRTARLLAAIMHDSLPPRLDPVLVTNLISLSAQTLSMSILAMSFAGLGGIVLSFPAARNFLGPGGILDVGGSRHGRGVAGMIVFIATRSALLVARATSEPIWALVVLFVLFPGPLPGALGLGVYNLGILGRLMAEINENLDERPLRALKAQGASGAQVFLYGVLPRALPRFLACILYRWEVCIRATVVVGLVGAGGLGRLLTEQLSSFDYRSVVTTLLCLFTITLLVDLASAAVRRTLR